MPPCECDEYGRPIQEEPEWKVMFELMQQSVEHAQKQLRKIDSDLKTTLEFLKYGLRAMERQREQDKPMCKPTDCPLWEIREGLRIGGFTALRLAHLMLWDDKYSNRLPADHLLFVDRMLAAKCPCDKGDETDE